MRIPRTLSNILHASSLSHFRKAEAGPPNIFDSSSRLLTGSRILLKIDGLWKLLQKLGALSSWETMSLLHPHFRFLLLREYKDHFIFKNVLKSPPSSSHEEFVETNVRIVYAPAH